MSNTRDTRTAAAKLAVLDSALGISALAEPALFERLEALYYTGFGHGVSNLKSLVEDVTRDLSKIVLAHMAKDAEQVKRLLDDMVRDHVKVVSDASKTTH